MGETTAAIPCSEAVRQLWDYLDHAIAPEDQERVEHHLSFCRRCCGELEFAKEIARLLDAPLGTILARLHRGRNLLERTMWVYAAENGLTTTGEDDG